MVSITERAVPDHKQAIRPDVPRGNAYHALLRLVEQGHNLSLVGPAGSGKTRLLRAICGRPPREFPDAPLPVYLDLRPLANATQEECLARLAEALIRALRRAGSAKDSRWAGARASCLVSSHLLAVLGKRTFHDIRVCYALDHFEYAACNTRLSTAVFGALRSLCSQPNVSIICATRVPLWQFEKLSSCTSSALPNVFLTWAIGAGKRVSETHCPSQRSSN
jgi:hypothetical protein